MMVVIFGCVCTFQLWQVGGFRLGADRWRCVVVMMCRFSGFFMLCFHGCYRWPSAWGVLGGFWEEFTTV